MSDIDQSTVRSGRTRLVSSFAALAVAFCVAVEADRAEAAEEIVIGVPAWPSAAVTANILARVLETEFGVETRLTERGNLGILADIDSGSAHIHPEVWFPNLQDAVDRYAAGNGSLRISPIGVPATQNICVTQETSAQTGIDSIDDLADPEMAAKFDTDGDGMGEMWIGAPTWVSTSVERVRARSYGYDRTMTLLEAPEDVAMAAIDVSVSLARPIVFYCYGPHHVFQLHEIRRLKEPVHDPATWNVISPAQDPDWLTKSKAASGWDLSHFHIGYATSLASTSPAVANFLTRVAFEREDITAMSYAVEVEHFLPADAALAWIADNGARIREWTK